MAEANIHIGTSGWSYKDWVGPFYPEGTKSTDYLRLYSRRFNTVEIDSTFYGIPRPATVEKWKESTPEEFVFSPKVPSEITHENRLRNADSVWEYFLQTMRLLGPKLGPVVLQFDYKFTFDEHFEQLHNFLKTHAKDVRICVEIRNRNWHREEFYNMLSDYNCALVLNDLYYMPRIVRLTADYTYIRLLGNRKQIPDNFSHVRVNREKDLDWWASWIDEFLEKELEVYIYSNNRYQGHAPATLEMLQERIDSSASTS